jgi:hypothetical protein
MATSGAKAFRRGNVWRKRKEKHYKHVENYSGGNLRSMPLKECRHVQVAQEMQHKHYLQ